MDVDYDCRNYRLRLGLPELSQPFFGSWLSPDSASPGLTSDSVSASFPFDLDSTPPCSSYSLPLLSVPADSNTNELRSAINTDPLRIRNQIEIQNSDNSPNPEDRGQEFECRSEKSEIDISNLWLQAGSFSEGRPRQSEWEVTHLREERLGMKTSLAIAGKIECESRTREDTDVFFNPSNVEKEESTSAHFNFESIQESDLVRAALRALQGVSTAVSWLEQLAAAFSSTVADRSSERFTSLWRRSSSSCSLSKVLTEFAKAGRVACQLDFFTRFFLNQEADQHMDGRNRAQDPLAGDSSKKKRKRQTFMTDRNSDSLLNTPTEIWEDVGGPSVSPHCHTNQAFAAAVKAFMQGHLASLDKIGASVKNRRRNTSGRSNVQVSEAGIEESGFVFGFGCGDVTLLELFLHSHKQREQLQALAALCRIDEETISDRSSENIWNETRVVNDLAFEMETHLFSASRNAFKEFPRGAELLSYLFNKLLVVDTLHLELTRFLFERACQPYIVFIRSWLYLASVQDPFGEFFVKALPSTVSKKSLGKSREQDALLSYQVSKGVKVPCFLEEVCTPLLRAGQQLQVLSKLLDTPSVSNIVDSPFKSSGRFEDTLLASSFCCDTRIDKAAIDGPMPTSSVKEKQGNAQKPKRSSKIFEGFFDASLVGVVEFPLSQQETGSFREARSPGRFWMTAAEDRSEQKAWTTKEKQEINIDIYQGCMERAALWRTEIVDEIPGASPTRPETPQSPMLSSNFSTKESNQVHAGQFLKSRPLDQICLKSEHDASFISEFQRGTSWPVLGLPKNPFRCCRDEGDNSLNYVYTVFPENNGCWDVNVHWRDPYSVSRVQAEQKCYSSEDGDQPFWLKNLEDYLSKQLTQGLDEQIFQADFDGLGYQLEKVDDHQSAYSFDFQPGGCNMSMQRSNIPQRNIGRRLQSSSFPLLSSGEGDVFGNHLYFSKIALSEAEDGEGLMSPKVNALNPTSVLGSDMLGPGGVKISSKDRSPEEGQIIPGASHAGPGSKWDSALQSEYQQVKDIGIISYIPLCEEDEDEEDEDDDEEIPLSVAVKLWIEEEILNQYKRTSTLTIRLLQESLHLQDHFSALRRYYFMERGDWAEYFLGALCKYEWNRIGGEPQLLEVQSMLRTALQNSSCDGDEFGDRLFIVQSGFDVYNQGLRNPFSTFSKQHHTLGTFVDCNKIEAFDFIKVGYKVEWPLSLIITPSAISRYSSIFTFLLRMKFTTSALADVWRNLQVIGSSLNKARLSSDYQAQNKKFRTLQLFRQQIGHVVTTLQRYTESQILHAVWSKFLYSVENEVNDIQDLEKVHSIYLNDAYHQCFLSKDMEDAKTCIDIIMQCTSDFRNTLILANLDRSGDSVPVNDDVYLKVLEVKSIFEVHVRKLYSYRRRSEPQYSILLSDFWMCLNYNGCFNPSELARC